MSGSGSKGSAQLPWLDWLRFVAALIVVLGHVRGQFFLDWSSLEADSRTLPVFVFFSITRLADLAVMAFFVISGYLVGGKLIERVKRDNFEIDRYVIDRFTRIYVPLFPALLLTFFVGWSMGETALAPKILGSVLSIQGAFTNVPDFNGPLWSLTYEVWFYIVAGAGAMLLTSSRGALSLAILFLAFCVFVLLNSHLLFVWFFGAFAYLIDYQSRLSRWLAAGASFILLSRGLVVSQLGSESQFAMLDLPPSAQGLGWGIFGVGLAISLPLLVSARTPKTVALSWLYGKGAMLAAFSYTTYLFHYPILYFFLDQINHERHSVVDLKSFSLFWLVVIALLVASFVCYIPFEKQTNRVRRAISSINSSARMRGSMAPGQLD